MILGMAIVVMVGGMTAVLAGVLAVAGRQTRQEEELARQAVATSPRAA